MPEIIIDGLGNSNVLKIDSNNAANVVGSVAITNSLNITSENVPYDTFEQYNGLLGSPTASTLTLSSGTSKTVSVKVSQDAYVDFDKSATINSFLLDAGQTLHADFKIGSVSTLTKLTAGSVWVWCGR